MKHTIYATKDLSIEDRPVKAGTVMATVETEHPLGRVLSGLANGHASTDGPPTKAKPGTPAGKQPAPTPTPAPATGEPAKA